MKIIALKGNENSGKSHTINIVYYFLLDRGFIQVPGHFRQLGNPVFEDIIDILESNGIKVGIIGMGDYPDGPVGVANLIQELIQKGCEIIICACTNKTGIVNSISHLPNLTFLDKTIAAGPENFRIINVIDAQRIVSLI